MKIFTSLLFIIPALSFAQDVKPEDIQSELDNSPVGSRVKLGTELQSKTVHVLEALYDFNRQGGDTATKYLLDMNTKKAASLPAGAIVTGCAIHVLTPLTSPVSPTVAFSTGQSVDDLKGETAKASLAVPDKLVACDLTSTVASWQKLGGYTDAYSRSYTSGYSANEYSREYTPTIKIKGGAVTGGKLALWIQYILNR